MLHCRPLFLSLVLDQNGQSATDLPDVVSVVLFFTNLIGDLTGGRELDKLRITVK